jgi:hypothetical protein
LNVEFILDGDGKPIDCLVGRWTPWLSVYIDGECPAEAFYSNEDTADYYRFQVLNDPADLELWTSMAAEEVNYGKFSDSIYPYQLWEPDAQQVTLLHIRTLRSLTYSSGSIRFY